MTQIKKKDVPKSNIEKLYLQMEEGGLNYINSQRSYLLLSVLFPIFAIIIQIINVIAILDPRQPNTPSGQNSAPLIHIFTPIIIVFVISAFALINLSLLLIWKKKVDDYTKQIPERNMTLTKLFYDIIRHMEMVKIFFIGLNFISLYYFLWYFSWLFSLTSDGHAPPPIHVIIFNLLLQIGLVFYLYFEWKHLLHWNQKLKELRKFEKEIFREICQSNK